MSRRRKPQSRNPAARPDEQRGQSGRAGAGGSVIASASSEDDASSEGSSAGDGMSKVAAVGLWVLVGGGLVYGVSQTLVKVVALFGG